MPSATNNEKLSEDQVHSFFSEESFLVLFECTYIRSYICVQSTSCISTVVREVLMGLHEW